jgi:16S rRNA (adenine1518-N6/adenine1519-N6)-dimethyltransferase
LSTSGDLVPGAAGRPAWSVFRAALEREGFRPSRRFGQNFLLDENMVRAIVRDAGVEPGDFVLEVGAGCGFLSLQLLLAGARLTSVEVDPRLASIVSELLVNEPRFALLVGDALDGKHALNSALVAALPASGAWKLVSNLPYSIAGPLLVLLSELPNPPQSMTVLVQREVALRLAAAPATSDWGPLSIRLQLDYEPKLVRDVPAGLFWPRPQVESSVVRLERRAVLLPEAERRVLSELVTHLFQHRRQTIARVLTDLVGDRASALAWLDRSGVEPTARAEDLSLERLRHLSSRRSLPEES